MTTLIEWNYAVVSSHTEFKHLMLVVLDITCVIKCLLSGKTGFYDNKVIYLLLSELELFRAQTWYIDTSWQKRRCLSTTAK